VPEHEALFRGAARQLLRRVREGALVKVTRAASF
jgi:hypothetical protein